MNQEFIYETIPFEIAPEFEDEMFEMESERGGRRTFGSRTSSSFRPSFRTPVSAKGKYRPPVAKPKPRPVIRGQRWPANIIHSPYLPVLEPYPAEPEPSGSERIRWLQDCLNQVMGLQLPVNGLMGPETRSVIRSFQRERGIRASGIVGPDTAEALQAACGGQREFNFEAEPFNAYWNREDELEVKIMIDEPGRKHITEQVLERFKDAADREKIRKRITQLIGMPAPPDAVGPYEWYVQVGNLGDGTDYANIVVVGHMIRSVLKRGMVVRGVRYVIRKGKLQKSGA